MRRNCENRARLLRRVPTGTFSRDARSSPSTFHRDLLQQNARKIRRTVRQRIASFFHRLHWVNVPAMLLIALLQRTPLLRLAAVAEERLVASPVSSILRSAVAWAASLGAVHALAGATTFVISRGTPITGTVGQPITSFFFTYTGAPASPASWRVTGSLPPGLSFTPAPNANNIINSSTPSVSGTPTQAGTFTVFVQGFNAPNATGDTNNTQVAISFTISGTAAVLPTFVAHPTSQTVPVGGTLTLTAGATGTPTPQLQWRRNGTNIAGATSTTFAIFSVQPSDAGDYSVVATNSAGSVASNAATVTVSGGAALPVFTTQPVAQTIASGSTVVFSAAATGATSYQWQRNTSNILGATSATLVLSGANAIAGSYRVIASSSLGSVQSAAVTLSSSSATNFGHLINLSILTSVSASDPLFTVGTVIGGAAGAKAILFRAAGPSLAPLGVPNVLADSKLELYAGTSVIASNDNWAGDSVLSSAFTSVGAFAYMSADSRDAAIFNPAIVARDYTVQVSGANGMAGTVIAELYDATPAAAFSAAIPRLINVSVRKHIEAGGMLTAGFVIGGDTSRTVLVRAIGPGLVPFQVPATMADPRLALFDQTQAKIAENDNWGGDSQLTAAGTAVGAFAIADTGSKDAMLLRTLPPGSYTVQVSGGTGAGAVLVEVYEVP